MDNQQPQTVKPISDDQELAEALAGVKQESENLNFEPKPIVVPTTNESNDKPEENTPEVTPIINPQPIVSNMPSENNGDLDGIKKDALTELKPLVDKLDLSPEEKFDIYLLMLRSTDDKTLIAPAHTAAQGIADETRRAQALLDVIKEIDYLSNQK